MIMLSDRREGDEQPGEVSAIEEDEFPF
jgi:hypothetical protein